MKCKICWDKGIDRELTDKEFYIHMKYFHQANTMPDGTEIKEPRGIDNGICPECGATVYSTGGCLQCYDCGWSKCG